MSITITLTADQIKQIAAHIMAEWAGVSPRSVVKHTEESIAPDKPRKPSSGKSYNGRTNRTGLQDVIELLLEDSGKPLTTMEVGKQLFAYDKAKYEGVPLSTISGQLGKLIVAGKVKKAGKIGKAQLYQIATSNIERN